MLKFIFLLVAFSAVSEAAEQHPKYSIRMEERNVINEINVPDGGSVFCVKIRDNPSHFKKCADGNIVSTKDTTCGSTFEVTSIQVTNTPPTIAVLKELSKFGSGYSCIVYIPK